MIPAARAVIWAIFLWMWYSFARTDILEEKIRNRHLLMGIVATACVYAVLLYGTWRGEGTYLVFPYFKLALSHAGVSLMIALALWLARVWPAGDAKLFAVLAFFFPLLDPTSPLLTWRMILACLLNIFVPASLFVFVQAFQWIWKTRLGRLTSFIREVGLAKWLKFRLSESLDFHLPKMPLSVAVAVGSAFIIDKGALLVVMGALMTVLTMHYGESMWTGLILCVFSFVVWRSFRAVLGRIFPALAVIAAVWYIQVAGLSWHAVGANTVRLAVYGACMGIGMNMLLSSIKGKGPAALLMAVLPILAGFLGLFINISPLTVFWAVVVGGGMAAVSVETQEDTNDRVPADIRPRMILAPQSLEKLKADRKFYDRHFETVYPDGLTDDQAEAVRAWCAKKKVERLSMQKTLSFAFWIFLGYCTTVLIRQDVLAVMLRGGL